MASVTIVACTWCPGNVDTPKQVVVAELESARLRSPTYLRVLYAHQTSPRFALRHGCTCSEPGESSGGSRTQSHKHELQKAIYRVTLPGTYISSPNFTAAFRVLDVRKSPPRNLGCKKQAAALPGAGEARRFVTCGS